MRINSFISGCSAGVLYLLLFATSLAAYSLYIVDLFGYMGFEGNFSAAKTVISIAILAVLSMLLMLGKQGVSNFFPAYKSSAYSLA